MTVAKGTMLSMYENVKAFTDLYYSKFESYQKPTRIDFLFIFKMIQDELREYQEAKDEAEQIDALLDAIYYILNAFAKVGFDLAANWTSRYPNCSSNDMFAYTHVDDLLVVGPGLKPLSFDNIKSILKFPMATLVEVVDALVIRETQSKTISSRLSIRFDDDEPLTEALLIILETLIELCKFTRFDPRPIWDLIHNANMSKYKNGYVNGIGKLCKGPDFISPDDDIRKEIERQKTMCTN